MYTPSQAPAGMRDFDELRRWVEEEFRRLASSLGSDNVDFTRRIFVDDYGAISYAWGTASTSMVDSTTAIQRAINAMAGGRWGTLDFGRGVYKVTSLVVAESFVKLRGHGKFGTALLYAPTVDGTCLAFANAGIMSFNGLEGMTIATEDTTHSKNALLLIDTSGFSLRDVSISTYPSAGPVWRGGVSCGVRVAGRENFLVDDLTSYAEWPVIVDVNPHYAPISADSFSIGQNTLYSGTTGNPCVTIVDGVVLYNTVFNGPNNWIGVGPKLKWIDTTALVYSSGLVVRNLKSEQGTGSITAFTIDIQHTAGLYGFSCENSLGGDTSAFKFRGVKYPLLKNWDMHIPVSVLGLVGVDVDTSVVNLTLEAMDWHSSIGNAISGGLTLVRSDASPSGASIPFNAFYKV